MNAIESELTKVLQTRARRSARDVVKMLAAGTPIPPGLLGDALIHCPMSDLVTAATEQAAVTGATIASSEADQQAAEARHEPMNIVEAVAESHGASRCQAAGEAITP